jgi:hypothetical protein
VNLCSTTNDLEGPGGYYLIDISRKVLGRGRTPLEAFEDARETFGYSAVEHHRCSKCGHLDMDPTEPFEIVRCDEMCMDLNFNPNAITGGYVQWEHMLLRYVYLDWAQCIGCRDKYELNCAVCEGNGIDADEDEDPTNFPAPDPGPGGRGLLRFVDLIHGREPSL